MSQPTLRLFLGLTLALAPLMSFSPVQASSRAPTSTPSFAGAGLQTAARLAENGPPVMQQAAQFEAGAPPAQSTAPAIKPTALRTSANPRLFREVFGFAFASSLGDPTIGYPSWNFALLSTVAYFGLHVDWTGNLVSDSALSTWNNPNGPVPGFINTAHANGTKVVLTIIMDDATAGTPNMCSALQRGSITISQTVSQVLAKGVDGVNVDYESNYASCVDPSTGAVTPSQTLYTTFIRNLRAALPSGSYLSLDSYTSSAGDRSGSTYHGFFDVSSLANYVDAFFVMAYDMEYYNWSAPPLNCSSFCIGPTSPLTTYLYNVSQASAEYRAVVPASKILMGVPYYGRKVCVAGVTPSSAPANAVASTSASAEGYLDASTENGYIYNSDYQIHRDVQDTTGSTRWDTFTSSTAACTRELYWDDVTSLANKYTKIITDGLRGAGIFALNYGGGAPELWSLLNTKFGQCANATIAADHSSPQIPATTVTFTGTAFCAGTAQYRFWMQPPGGGWSLVQDYSTSPTLAWDTTGKALGTYKVEVDARNLGSAVSYDTTASTAMRLALCVTPTLTPDHPSPQLPGPLITLTAAVTCQGTPEYRFWIQAPGSGWTMVRDYGPGATYSWDTSHLAYGNYGLEVDTRDQGTGVSYESVQAMTFEMTSCITPTLTTDKLSPQPTGTQIVLTGAASCTGTPMYRFWVRAPGAGWSVLQGYGPSGTFSWTPGQPDGDYQLEFDAIGSGAPAGSLVHTSEAFTITACTGAGLTTSVNSPQVAGTPITLTGSAACAGTAQYRFWIRPPGAGWGIVQDYGPLATYAWTTNGLPLGTYWLEVDVRNTGATAGYETTTNQTFMLANQACTTPTLTPSVGSPQPTGTQVTLSSTTGACALPTYRFWIEPPGGGWSIARDYTSSPSFTWSATGPGGTYGLEVDVRDASRSSLTYDAVANTTFVINACTAVNVTTDRPSQQPPGAPIVISGAATCPGTPDYRFWIKPPSGGWSMVQDYGAGASYAWNTAGRPSGTYGLEVDVRDLHATATYEAVGNSTFVLTPPCTTPSLTPSLASPQAAGVPVSFAAAAGACPVPQYRFWMSPPGGAWTVVQDYGPSATFAWSGGTVAGVYRVEVDARGQGSLVTYDAVSVSSFTVVPSAPCTGVTLAAGAGPPGGTGTAVTFTGTAAGCPSPEYRFWVQAPGARWSVARDYSVTPTYTWPGGSTPGAYQIEVDVRGLGSTVTYDAHANATYQVNACAGATLAADHTSPQAAGSTVIFTGSATCLGTPEYRFWVKAPGGAWSVVRSYGPGATYSWNTMGLAPGVYSIEVDIRNQGAAAGYETVANVQFSLS